MFGVEVHVRERKGFLEANHMGVSKNRGTPKWMV